MIVLSSGTAPAAATWSRMYSRRFLAARSSRSLRSRRRRAAASGSLARSSRVSAPIARPNSSGRVAVSPFQNGIFPGTPGAGETSTRSCVISSTRQVDAPRRNVSPTRVSNTISSSSSPTRAVPVLAPARNTP